jgi:DedD protein
MPDQPPLDEQNETKKRAIRRLAAAFVLIMLAVTALTFISHYKPEKPVTKTAEETVLPPEEPQIQPAPPVEPAAPLPPPPPPEVVNEKPKPAEPAQTAAPETAKPAEKPEVSARPSVAKTPAPTPALPKPRGPEKEPLTLRKAEELEGIPAETAKPVAPRPPAEKAPPAAKAAPEPAPKGYTVQLGVFSNPANALQLQEKLAQHGIRSYTETRLQIGPFKDRAEAENALRQVRNLGIGAVVVPIH